LHPHINSITSQKKSKEETMALTIRFNPEPSDRLVNEVETLLGVDDLKTEEYQDGYDRVLKIDQPVSVDAKETLQNKWGKVAIMERDRQTIYVLSDKIEMPEV
jgi:hypothetical protein